MQVLQVGSLVAVAAGAAVATNRAGFLPGETVAVIVSSPDGVFAGAGQVQTSVDGVTYTNVGTAASGAGTIVRGIRLENFIRLNVTARTAGTLEAFAIGATD